MKCYCCSGATFSACCEPLITRKCEATTAEALMRSRFTAYCLNDYDYILQTYCYSKRQELTENVLRESAAGIMWFALNAISLPGQEPAVEFSAFYFEGKRVGVLHETSLFVQEASVWKYQTGTIHQDSGFLKIGRNDQCPCKSGKKFKQCCLRKIA